MDLNIKDIKRKIDNIGNNIPLRVLVVDDDTACQRLISNALPTCEVHFAETGEEAIRILDRYADQFDVLMVDERLPGKLGHEVIKEVTRRWPDLPAALVTGYGFSDNDKIRECGARAFIDKPLDDHREEIERFFAETRAS